MVFERGHVLLQYWHLMPQDGRLMFRNGGVVLDGIAPPPGAAPDHVDPSLDHARPCAKEVEAHVSRSRPCNPPKSSPIPHLSLAREDAAGAFAIPGDGLRQRNHHKGQDISFAAAGAPGSCACES